MRIRLDLNLETAKRLAVIALAERRTAADQAQVILETALGVRSGHMSQAELPLMFEAELQSHDT